MVKAQLTALVFGLLNLTGRAALAQPERYWGPDMMWGGWFHMFFGFLMMLLFLAIIVGLVVLGVRWLSASEHSPFRHSPRQGERAPSRCLKM